MNEFLFNYYKTFIGLDGQILNSYQMGIRAFLVYTLAIMLIRLGRKRFLAKPSSFDLVLILIFGSILSMAIAGNTPFLPTITTASLLILFHTFFSYLTFYSAQFGALIKGATLTLIENGIINWTNMKQSQITERDLMAALRRNAAISDVSQVKLAVLERNGEISVIPKVQKFEIIDIAVEEGVQIIKLEIK